MTAPDPRLVALLSEHALWYVSDDGDTVGCSMECGWSGRAEDHEAHLAAVVEVYVQTRIAEALDEAADDVPKSLRPLMHASNDEHYAIGYGSGAGPEELADVTEGWLRDRAAAHRPGEEGDGGG